MFERRATSRRFAIRSLALLAAALVVGIGAIALPVIADPPTSRPADAAAARALGAEIDALLKEAAASQPTTVRVDALAVEAERHDRIASKAAEFLQRFPTDPDASRFAIARLRALYNSACARGHEFDLLEEEVGQIDTARAIPALREAVEYWKSRMARMRAAREIVAGGGERPEIGAAAHLPPQTGVSLALLEDFVRRQPDSPHAVPLVEQIVEAAYARGDVDSVEPWLALVEKHHAGDVRASALRGEQALHLAIGKPWRPAWTTVGGGPVDWSALTGRVTVVAFWSPRYGPSVSLLRRLARFMSQPGGERVAVVAVALDEDCEAARQAADSAGHAGPRVCDGLGWRSPIAAKWGIRILPTVLILDQDGNLRYIKSLGQRKPSQSVIQHVEQLLAPAAPESTSAPATPTSEPASRPAP